MKNHRLFWLLTMAPGFVVPFASGCMLLKAPEVAPTPTPAPTPKAPYFDPTAGQPRATPLNVPADPKKPEAFRVASAVTGDMVSIQSYKKVLAGSIKPGVPARDSISLGAPDTVRLAGIIAPTVDPGLQGARTAIAKWTLGQNVDIDIDGKVPRDVDGRRLVQIFFKGGNGPYKDQQLSLNRMLVRSGWAVVDMYSPTSFDTTQWILDESHAKRNNLGIWKYGQIIQQRLPARAKNNPNSNSKVQVTPTDRLGTTTTGTATTTTSQTQTSSSTTTPGAPVASPAAPAASPAVSNAASGQ
jgi:endonuclease YncB( thermonuclease family)